MDQHLHRAPSETGRDLSAQQPGRGAGHKDLDAAGVDQSAYETLPARNVLDLIQIQGDVVSRVQLRNTAGVFLKHPAQVGHGDAGEALVLQQKQQLRFGRNAGLQALGAVLGKKRGLAATPYADDGKRLPRDCGKPHVAARESARRQGQRLVELGAQQLSRYCHFKKDNIVKYVTL